MDEPILVKIQSNYDWHWWLPIALQVVVPLGAVFLAYWVGHRDAKRQYFGHRLLQEAAALQEFIQKLPAWADGGLNVHFEKDAQMAALKGQHGELRVLCVKSGLRREFQLEILDKIKEFIECRDNVHRAWLIDRLPRLQAVLDEKRAQLESMNL